jgi:hypothetical protein
MRLEFLGLKKILILLMWLLPGSLMWLSCGGSTPSSAAKTSGLKYRAFISNSVSAGSLSAGVYIVNAEDDLRGTASAVSAGNSPGMMVVTPNLAQTLVFSGNGTQSSDNQFSIISNATESNAAHLALPGMTESFVVSPDSATAYVALPTAPVIGQSPGFVEAIALGSGSVSGQVGVPAVHYLSIDNGGNRILGFSDNSDYVSVITPSQIGIGNAVTTIGGPSIFDRPVTAFFSSDDTTAWVLSCGAECGGSQASLEQYSFASNSVVASVPLCTTDQSNNTQCSGSVALINGSTMYVAGTPYSPAGDPSLLCPAGTTMAQYCGQLLIVNLSNMSVTNAAPIIITDGYHNRIALGPNGQLFIGARTCTEIIAPVPPPAGAEVRGCLSIYNTLTNAVGTNPAGGVLVPPENGDVTGLQPISVRGSNMPQYVVYVIQGQGVPQGGSLFIYDTTIDALENNPNNTNNPGQIFGLVGNFVDVKTVD